MGTESHILEPGDGLTKVRTHLMTSLHLGRLKPGDRVPSVRRMAALTGLNRKTVHRAYIKLSGEGFLQTRQGSGTYLTDDSRSPLERPAPRRLLDAVTRCRDEARALGLTANGFARFLTQFVGEGLEHVEFAIVECNREQTGMIARDVKAALRCKVRPVLLEELTADVRTALAGVQAVITTDCHRQEVQGLVAPFDLPLYRVALDPEFSQTLIQRARLGTVLMVVKDPQFEGPWRRLMKQLRVSNELGERFSFVEPRGLIAALRAQRGRPSIFVSPLVEAEIQAGLFDPSMAIPAMRYLETPSLERLKVMALFDLHVAPEDRAPRTVPSVSGKIPERRSNGELGYTATH